MPSCTGEQFGMKIAGWWRMHPTRRARRKATRPRPGAGPVTRTEAPTVDIEARKKTTEQLDPRLPHERDQVASGKEMQPRGIIESAHDDLASGQVHTDSRNRTEETIQRKSGQGLRHKP